MCDHVLAHAAAPVHICCVTQTGNLARLYGEGFGPQSGARGPHYGGHARVRAPWTERRKDAHSATWWDSHSAAAASGNEVTTTASAMTRRQPQPPPERQLAARSAKLPRFRNVAMDYQDSVLGERVALAVSHLSQPQSRQSVRSTRDLMPNERFAPHRRHRSEGGSSHTPARPAPPGR